MRRWAVVAVVGAGCGGTLDPQSGAALDAFSYGWERYNHRLSHLGVEPDADVAKVAVVGGTSTTSERPDLDDTCDPEGCSEFPFLDASLVDVRWTVLESDRTALVPFSADLEVGPDGASTTVEVALPSGARGEATALLSGFVLDTDHPLATGPSCYQPRFGWHVRRLELAIGAPAVDGDRATVEVTSAFEAGNTHDPERACIDEVNEQAVVALRVDGLLLVGKDLAVEEQEVSSSAAFPFSGDLLDPEEQVPPEPEQLSVGVDAVASGLASMAWRFYPEDPEGQGAYLRTLGWTVSPDGVVGASATNYSPGTQLEDFAYEVDLAARFVAFDGIASTRSAAATLPTLLDAEGDPVVHELSPSR